MSTHNPAAEYVEATDPDHAADLARPVEVEVVGAVRVLDFPPRTVTTDQTPVGAQAVKLLNENRTRASATLSVVGADLFIGGPSVTPGTGYKVPNGGGFTLTATGALYAVTAGATATVYVLSEHRDG